MTPPLGGYWADDAEVEAAEWLTEGWVPAKAFVFIYGRHGSAKSFLALDWALCSSMGIEWFGNETQEPFGTIYCVGEKKSRFGKRAVAWLNQRARRSAKAGVFIREGCPNLLDPDEVERFIAEVNAMKPHFEQRGVKVRAIILDTWARSLGGADPSDANSANQANEAVQRIIDRTSCTVIPIAHMAKAADATTIKGAGEYGDAADAYIRVERIEGKRRRTATLGKQSDGEDGLKFCFEPDQVEVGTDAKGKQITSILLRQVDQKPEPNKMSRKVAPRLDNVVRCVNMCLDAGQSEYVPSEAGVPAGTQGVLRAVLKGRLVSEGILGSEESPENRKKMLNRDIKTLVNQNRLRADQLMVWLSDG